MKEKPETFETVIEDIVRRVVRQEIPDLLNGRQNDRPEKPYLTIKEAADFSRLAVSTLRLYIRQRKLRAFKEGRRVIIKSSDLENFLESNPVEIRVP